MELFNEYKNRYFQCIQNIINDIYNGVKYEEKDIINFFKNNTFNEIEPSLVWQILNKESRNSHKNVDECRRIKLLKENNNNYTLSIDSNIPIRPTKIELRWLKMLIEDPKSKAIIDDTIVKKLTEKLKTIETWNYLDYWIQKNIDKNGDKLEDEKFKSFLKILSTAIQEDKSIKYTSINKKGKLYKDKIGFPYRIEYSIRNNKYRVAVLPIDCDRVIKINVSSFKSIEIMNKIDTKTKDKILNFINSKKNLKNPLVLEVENRFNTVERCFSLFSHYDKEAYIDKEKNKHILKVYYYSFEESEIVRDILSLGSSVIVVEPTSIRNKVIERIRKHFCDG
ncbi:WYL domain-containing protein [Caminicella sporogenes DSM 14501]|uniref:WYL domain-containing protein n=1 Tax=Caminicella sporogenes DSM 14501 TaxID=1121266 RepID=A0A1M6RDD3_9FIRM|nr:WYL domain-containing protein [Caminicella sporogenes]RKD25200.1 hypothetical protein BET04_02990 [Caminicella sporogenes]SHK30452.1 WYL domain-containing protein [Caminicella sporogenes DSM 14501]